MYSIDTVHSSHLAARNRVRQYTQFVALLKRDEDAWAQRLQEAGYVVMEQGLRRVALDGIEVEDDEQDMLLKCTADTVFANYIAAQHRVRQYTQFLTILKGEEEAWAQRFQKATCIPAGGMGRHLRVILALSLSLDGSSPPGIFSTPVLHPLPGLRGLTRRLPHALGPRFLLSFCGFFIWLEFGTTFPHSGGEKVYLKAAYRKP
ncbi:hypothetical protein F4604DRAFT_1930262 [Suillus subluteus]|nr:hypothetical protein F4604DRAFT_1930262 [Suillus subluteus]